jgi:hypothetical protein
MLNYSGEVMKLHKTLAMMAFTLMSGAAMAQQCPEQLKKVDDAMARGPKLPPEQIAEARKHRSTAERLLREGKANDCMDSANKALLILAAG